MPRNIINYTHGIEKIVPRNVNITLLVREKLCRVNNVINVNNV